MIVVFSGCREGMRGKQFDSFCSLVYNSTIPDEFHHGCCFGSDVQACVSIRSLLPDVVIVGHPSGMRNMQDRSVYPLCDIIEDEKPPLVRNQDMVDVGDVLIATPYYKIEELHSGTWSTIRRARKKKGMKIFLVHQDGEIICEDFSIGVVDQTDSPIAGYTGAIAGKIG